MVVAAGVGLGDGAGAGGRCGRAGGSDAHGGGDRSDQDQPELPATIRHVPSCLSAVELRSFLGSFTSASSSGFTHDAALGACDYVGVMEPEKTAVRRGSRVTVISITT